MSSSELSEPSKRLAEPSVGGSSTESEHRSEERPSRRFLIAQWTAYLLAAAIMLPLALTQFLPFSVTDVTRTILGTGLDDKTLYLLLVETPVFLPLLLAAPLLWIRRRPLFRWRPSWSSVFGDWFGEATKPTGPSREWAGTRAWTLAVAVGVTSLAVSAGVAQMDVGDPTGARFGALPPAYHDEYSYLFQAKTFLAGRVAFPTHPQAPELFDQMHVLNDHGVFASRYFPGVGAWIVPFLMLGKPYWAQWLGGALTAMFLFWTGRELGGNGVGLLAGLLTAASPAMGLFSNLLLSHLPTLVGLSLFVFTFLRMMRTQFGGDAVWAGLGLSFAMLCRPLTAAAVGLPFGIWFLYTLVPTVLRGNRMCSRRLTLAAALGAPLLAGLLVMFAYNRSITGSGWTTPYQLYTNIYTPRHIYGFNNRVRGEERLSKYVGSREETKVLANYDQWAENLTPDLAVRNVRNRLIASWQWTLGIVPLLMGTVVFVIAGPGSDRRWWLIPGSILALHAAYFPYWFDGIMHWHYVFESGPLWLLMFAGATSALVQGWRRSRRPAMPVWWTAIILAALLPGYTSFDGFWPLSRMEVGVNEAAFSRKTYAAFQRMIDRQVTSRPALVLIEPDPADRHIDFVVNDPGLDAPVLFGRFRPGKTDVAQVMRLFPERAVYFYRARTGQLVRLMPQKSTKPEQPAK